MKLGLIARSPWVLDSIAQWAVDLGLKVLEKSGLLVKVEGDLEHIEHALKVRFERLEQGWHTDHAPTLPPHVVAVSGLSTKGRVYPHLRAHKLDNPTPPIVTNGPHPGLTPSQVATAYQVSGSWDGTGQTIAIAAWGVSFQQADIDAFCQQLKIPAATVDVVPINGYQNTFSPNDGPETTLDICWSHAMAPGATVRVYMAPGGTNDEAWALQVTNLLNTVLTDSVVPAVLSISYGDGETQFHPSDLQAWEHLIAQLTAKGIPVFVSSGDQGSYGLHAFQQAQIPRVDAPASCPSAVAVGGTALWMNLLQLEDEWAWANDAPFQGATGGGYSQVFTTPNYQSALKLPMRGVPDLAAVGSPSTPAFLIYNGQYWTIGGTSLAAPVVAGIFTRIAHQRHAQGHGPLGDLHDVLYQHGPTLCRDITVGNNQCFAVPGYFANPGWDECTGWGSPIYPQWQTIFAERTTPANPSSDPPAVNPATLTVAQLAQAADGAYGSANLPLQQAARTVEAALGQATYFGLAHHPVGYFDTAQKAAAQLWDAGVTH